ncbi:Crp/Fnr family transcriptional regulator [Providencia hangzhouensis]|uniref:Regulatory protein YeiL n=1 Tax=Providencia rettgeri TaxID=587 RepID=A0A809SKP1_PRORE|nr:MULTISPECIES: Crp/Fnr family transcriptional regulator [Providencia]MBN7841557.1 Crp/Fnr family transcriptional regulator [Providencia rettgeri]MBN7853903.1 Crp/Fnr family transcriptional regulator [Providencia rettgeri]MBN7864404.1 Crp/Fnr family transcriptional regulator [Providencia rettgeri]MBN7872054.1 Crp/Fnr family transcriptional regulator [Providencia rettgeri]MBN7898940.1 Crp/Fnr family transcriptional regulator [Providencia rettgeri]
MKKITSSEKIEEYFTLYQLDKILSEETIKSAKLLKIGTSEYLISQNDKINFIYFLVAGKLQVERYEINGEHVIFSFENAFSVIGDLELFQNNDSKKNRIYSTIQAITECYLLAFPLQVIQKKELNSPIFLQFICQHLSKKLFNTSQLHSSSSFSAEYKLRRYLIFAESQYGSEFKLENRDSLAAMLGISVRQLNRTLVKLIERKLIELKGKHIKIIDLESAS